MKKYFIYNANFILLSILLSTTIACSKKEIQINFNNELNKFRDIHTTKTRREIFNIIGSKRTNDLLTVSDLNQMGFNIPSIDKSFVPKFNLAAKWIPTSKYVLVKITLEKSRKVSNSKIIQIAPNNIFDVELNKFEDLVSPKIKEEISNTLIGKDKNDLLENAYLEWIGYNPPNLSENFKATYNLNTNIDGNFQHINIKVTLITKNEKSLPKIIKIEPLDIYELKKFNSHVISSKNKIQINQVLSDKEIDDILDSSDLIQMGYIFPSNMWPNFTPIFRLQKKWNTNSKKAVIQVTLMRTIDRKLCSSKNIEIQY